ncbi:hypothetical protein [Phenylobacterium sp.]|uniref:hypothetical protein n=1 Tax=Phenylobacterium sp. TaxID=1871053 RepID=UPI0035AF7725
MTRLPGFYWVRLDRGGTWQPAFTRDGRWWVIGSDRVFLQVAEMGDAIDVCERRFGPPAAGLSQGRASSR